MSQFTKCMAPIPGRIMSFTTWLPLRSPDPARESDQGVRRQREVMPEFRVYAPLSEFSWQGSTVSVAPGVEIIQRPQPYPLRDLDEPLTELDRNKLFFASH